MVSTDIVFDSFSDIAFVTSLFKNVFIELENR